ncbi:uncharacterized protein [Venturia canescens]|uniref:uncharacterized protein n=1 Tax=Venturia canescens TaxID=32260 RepID=UPI001C9C523A|nr:uncharacterized protein LOC122419047 [Venturia canescens]
MTLHLTGGLGNGTFAGNVVGKNSPGQRWKEPRYIRPINIRRSKGSKSDVKLNKQGASFLENAVLRIEERRADLANRQHCLREKITAMERSIPALMAFNMWKSGSKCNDPPMCKIRQIMKKMSPNSDPTEKLVDGLKNTVESLKTETGELHDKIIAADIKLEESEMELESLELENKEFDERLQSLQKELTSNKTPSLHSIHSEDLICLARIRELGEEEMNFKNSIRELEERETIFQEQINRILTSRDFQKSMSTDQPNERKVQELKNKTRSKGKEAEKSVPKKPVSKPSTSGAKTVAIMEPAKKALTQLETSAREKYLKSPAGMISGLTMCHDKTTCPASSKPSVSNRTPVHRNARNSCGVVHQKSHPSSISSPKSCCSALSTKSSGSQRRSCLSCCKNSSNPRKSSSKWYGRSSAPQWKCCKGKACCQLSFAKKSGGAMCKRCQGWIPPSQIRTVSKNAPPCMGKCAVDESETACNCSKHLESLEHRGHENLKASRLNDQSASDEEYSECCDCGCNDSDISTDSCEF